MSLHQGPNFIHANALIVGAKGLLLRGPSGSGKSALTLALIAQARQANKFACLVADDRVQIEAINGRIIARPHEKIAGCIEARGLGLITLPYLEACVLHAIIDLACPDQPQKRLPDESDKITQLMGIQLPRLVIAAHDWTAVTIINHFIQ
jgi:serine kinase of HPr protein (carbohydrate metabolism regulator)